VVFIEIVCAGDCGSVSGAGNGGCFSFLARFLRRRLPFCPVPF
jgi:hypothetical protein